ncbi:tetratricopeptide repeat protein [Ruminococcus sp.]|uniref:tetratricopeptide repeat protein n=1 Tax=Ruminococcus sp. TaxID=41978 RepID=UPI0025D942F1|nr:tetratricopeptide repeat protein [Ruminococcus sp.]
MSGNDKKIDEAVISEEQAETAISESETEQLSENKNGDCENHNDGSENDTVQTCTELAVIDLENTEKKSLIFDKIKKSKKKIIIVASSVVVLIIVFIITFSVFIIPMLKYNNAKTLMEQKNYSEAKAEFEQLSGYNDSKELYKECEYNEAVELFDSKKYEEARTAFEKFGNYEKSSDYIVKCDYNIGIRLQKSGKYDDAIKQLKKNPDYEDSENRIILCYRHLLIDYIKENGSLDDDGTSYTITQRYDMNTLSFKAGKDTVFTKPYNYVLMQTNGSYIRLSCGIYGLSTSKVDSDISVGDSMFMYSIQLDGDDIKNDAAVGLYNIDYDSISVTVSDKGEMLVDTKNITKNTPIVFLTFERSLGSTVINSNLSEKDAVTACSQAAFEKLVDKLNDIMDGSDISPSDIGFLSL